jgi:hypothetical protein
LELRESAICTASQSWWRQRFVHHLSARTVIGVNLAKDVITTPAVNLPVVPTDAGGHFVACVNATFTSEYLREVSKHFKRA